MLSTLTVISLLAPIVVALVLYGALAHLLLPRWSRGVAPTVPTSGVVDRRSAGREAERAEARARSARRLTPNAGSAQR